MMNFINKAKSAVVNTWSEVSPEVGYAVSGVIRLTKVSLHTVGDLTNGAASSMEVSSAFAEGFLNEGLGGTTQPERVAGAKNKGGAAYDSLFGEESKTADAAGL